MWHLATHTQGVEMERKKIMKFARGTSMRLGRNVPYRVVPCHAMPWCIKSHWTWRTKNDNLLRFLFLCEYLFCFTSFDFIWMRYWRVWMNLSSDWSCDVSVVRMCVKRGVVRKHACQREHGFLFNLWAFFLLIPLLGRWFVFFLRFFCINLPQNGQL